MPHIVAAHIGDIFPPAALHAVCDCDIHTAVSRKYLKLYARVVKPTYHIHSAVGGAIIGYDYFKILKSLV
jgi:hypothetical protein